DLPPARVHDDDLVVGIAGENSRSGRESAPGFPSERHALSRAVAEGFGQALAIEGIRGGYQSLGSTEERASRIGHLPDIGSRAKAWAEQPNVLRRIEHRDAQLI